MGALDFLRRGNDKKADPFSLLKQDHRTVEELFKQLEEGTGDRNQLFRQLKSELELHTQIEETIFYPALKNDEETRDIVLEAFEEHKGVKTLLQEMDTLSKQDERWDAKLKVLKENVEHHVEEEEGEMFQKAKDVLSEEEQEKLGEQMLREKEKATTGTEQPGEERKSRTAESRAQRASSVRKTRQRSKTELKKAKKSSRKQAVSSSRSRSRSQQSRGQQSRSQASPARKRQKAQRSSKRVVARKTSKRRSR